MFTVCLVVGNATATAHRCIEEARERQLGHALQMLVVEMLRAEQVLCEVARGGGRQLSEQTQELIAFASYSALLRRRTVELANVAVAADRLMCLIGGGGDAVVLERLRLVDGLAVVAAEFAEDAIGGLSDRLYQSARASSR